MPFDNYKFTIRLPSGGETSSSKDNEWDQYIVNSTFNGTITAGDNSTWNWRNIYSWTSTALANSPASRTVRGYSSSVYSNYASTNWVSNICGFRPVLLIESLYTPTVKYLFEDNGEVKKYVEGNDYQDVTATMTGPNSPVPNAVTANGQLVPSESPWNAFDKNTNTLWESPNTMPSTGNPHWIKYDFGSGNEKIVKRVVIKPYVGIASVKNWSLYGSNDDVIYTLIGNAPTHGENDSVQTVDFLSNSTAYRYYKITFPDSYNQNGVISIAEIELHQEVPPSWATIGPAPATEEIFLNHGMDDLSIIDDKALQQLVSDTPKLLMWTDDVNKTSASVNLAAVPHGQLIFQEGDMDVSGGIEQINITGSNIKIIVSTDSGTNWKFFDGASWQSIEANAESVKDNGMTPEVVNGITKEHWKELLGNSATLRFAYYLEQNDINNTVNVDSINITPLPYATETPTLDSIKITYDDLTIEGRLKDLERINAINIAKLNFKSNALLQSEKYEMHDMIIDTCDQDEMTTISSSGAGEKVNEALAFSEPAVLGEGKVSEFSLASFIKMKKVEVK